MGTRETRQKQFLERRRRYTWNLAETVEEIRDGSLLATLKNIDKIETCGYVDMISKG